MNENFFRALKVEKSVMTILLALIILVAAFNIVATLIMVVMEKTKDIGILRSLGATRAQVLSAQELGRQRESACRSISRGRCARRHWS